MALKLCTPVLLPPRRDAAQIAIFCVKLAQAVEREAADEQRTDSGGRPVVEGEERIATPPAPPPAGAVERGVDGGKAGLIGLVAAKGCGGQRGDDDDNFLHNTLQF